MPAAAGYDPHDPTWMSGADVGDDRPSADELDPPPDVTRRPERFIPDPWQPHTSERDDDAPF